MQVMNAGTFLGKRLSEENVNEISNHVIKKKIIVQLKKSPPPLLKKERRERLILVYIYSSCVMFTLEIYILPTLIKKGFEVLYQHKQ